MRQLAKYVNMHPTEHRTVHVREVEGSNLSSQVVCPEMFCGFFKPVVGNVWVSLSSEATNWAP